MILGEQWLQVSNTTHKGKHPSHFSKGIPKASSYGIVVVNSIPIVVSFIFFLPKKIERSENSIRCSKMFELLSFHGIK
jgi:hypothetical protein